MLGPFELVLFGIGAVVGTVIACLFAYFAYSNRRSDLAADERHGT